MKKVTQQFLSLLMAFVFAFSITSCSDDDEDDNGGTPADVAGTLEGTWTSGTVTVNSITINGEDFTSYFSEQFQPLVDAGFLTQAEADALAAEFEGELTTSYQEDIEGSITFNPNGTYQTIDDDGTLSGTWSLTNNDQTLLIDEGTEDELSLQIVSLTNSRLEATYSEIETEDVDGDGMGETLNVSITYVFTR